MATDPTSLLRPSAKSTLPPPCIPPDLYPGVIKSYELTQSSGGNPLLRLPVGLLDWPSTISQNERVKMMDKGDLSQLTWAESSSVRTSF